jgi:hypothetical protein
MFRRMPQDALQHERDMGVTWDRGESRMGSVDPTAGASELVARWPANQID